MLVLVEFRARLGKVRVEYFGLELWLLHYCIKADDAPV